MASGVDSLCHGGCVCVLLRSAQPNDGTWKRPRFGGGIILRWWAWPVTPSRYAAWPLETQFADSLLHLEHAVGNSGGRDDRAFSVRCRPGNQGMISQVTAP